MPNAYMICTCGHIRKLHSPKGGTCRLVIRRRNEKGKLISADTCHCTKFEDSGKMDPRGPQPPKKRTFVDKVLGRNKETQAEELPPGQGVD